MKSIVEKLEFHLVNAEVDIDHAIVAIRSTNKIEGLGVVECGIACSRIKEALKDVAKLRAYLGKTMSIPGLAVEIEAVIREIIQAQRYYPDFHSAHEGYAVLLEEVDELWAEIKKRKQNPDRMRQEAIQVAAMAIRFVLDICEKEETNDEG